MLSDFIRTNMNMIGKDGDDIYKRAWYINNTIISIPIPDTK